MKIRPAFTRLHYLLSVLFLGLFVLSPTSAMAQEPTNGDQPYLSEVAPTANAENSAWVELTVGRVDLLPTEAENRLFLPLIQGGAGAAVTTGATVQAQAPQATVSLQGFKVQSCDGSVYPLPDTLPTLPKGTVVTIRFDGQGATADELDPADGAVTLHTPAGLTAIFQPDGDALALLAGDGSVRDFVAWGKSPSLACQQAAVAVDVWELDAFLYYDGGFGAGGFATPPTPNATFARYCDGSVAPGEGSTCPWGSYGPGQSSPGAPNLPPSPLRSTIPDGALLDADTFGVSWPGLGADFAYEFELDDAADFGSPLATQRVPMPGWKPAAVLPDGDYFWRLRAVDSRGNFSTYLGPFKVSLIGLGKLGVLGTRVTLLNADEYKIQHKDTTMLDIGGGPNNIVGSGNPGNRRYPADRRWDGEHVDANNVPRFGWNGSDNWNCVRASTAMVTDYYGGDLSQDRLSYYMFEEWDNPPNAVPPQQGVPEHDLGFGSGIGWYGWQEGLIEWATGSAFTGYSYCPDPAGQPDYSCSTGGDAQITFAQIKQWIDEGRPFTSVNLNNAHMRVVDGYWEISDTSRWVHVIDPVPADTNGCPTCTNGSWQAYDTFKDDHERAYVGPAGRNGAPNVRSDEASIHTDSDGDGISDFDETRRFGTDPNKADTDGDWVNDKNDLAEYVFDDDSIVGNYTYTPGMTPNTSDYDGDGKRKELDWDNDNDGIPDGCEDVDVNGRFIAGETSNFNPNSQQSCQPRFAIVDPVVGQAANAGDPAAPDKVLIRINMALPPALPNQPTFTAAQFSVTIGGIAAPNISGAPVGQEFWLLVQAPAQSESKFYDLVVNFAGAATNHADKSDTETNAVYYIPRPRMDTVVVFDRSGSMADGDKLASAKNAARLYIDQWAPEDRIGLVSFADSATVDKALTTIAADFQVLTDTKLILDGLNANGLTAMGPGLQAGQAQLTTAGAAEHDHTLMLLTDGQENVAPYWADASVSGVIMPSQTVVHTIGVGEPSATWFGLLQQIAGATGGTFGAVDDPSAVVVAADVAASQALDAFPDTTANQLADVYKYAAEQILGEQRIYEASGILARTNPETAYRFFVGAMPSLVVGANFSEANAGHLKVFDPNGTEINPAADVELRTDATHQQYRILNPAPGLWSVKLELDPLVKPLEYLLFAAGDSPLTLNLAVGEFVEFTTGAARVGAAPVIAILADTAPIREANIVVEIRTPNGWPAESITLFDDGTHGDGLAGDGIYGGTLVTTQRGNHLLKAHATGQDTAGDSFQRFAQASAKY